MTILWSLRMRRIAPEQRLFIAYLTLAFIVENTAAYLNFNSADNSWIYSIYIPMEFMFLMLMAACVLKKTWSTTAAIAGAIGYCGVLAFEIFGHDHEVIIFARSTLISYCLLTALYAALLIDLVERTTTVLWKDQRFWVYLSVFIFTGPAIPFVGLLNRIYARDPELAGELFVIIDVLFFLRYGAALIGGWLLKPRLQRAM